MGKPKGYEKRKKYGVTWIYLDGTWFVNDGKDAGKCGVHSGQSTKQLHDPKYLHRISSKKSYWDKYVK